MANCTVTAFIDGKALHDATRAIDLHVDFKRLREWLESRHPEGRILRLVFATLHDDQAEYSNVRPLLDYLEYNGYQLIVKPMRSYDEGRYRGSVIPELYAEALRYGHQRSITHAYLFAGDGDYATLVRELKQLGVVVTVVSLLSSMVADELRRAADEFVDLRTIIDEIDRSDR